MQFYKVLIFIHIILVPFFPQTQAPQNIIGNPIKIGKIIVAQFNFPEPMNWEDAKLACKSLGHDWRLPTKQELSLIFQNKNKIKGFPKSDFTTGSLYWSSNNLYNIYNHFTYAIFTDFRNGDQGNELTNRLFLVRAVKSSEY